MEYRYKSINSMYRQVVTDYNATIDPNNPPSIRQIRADLLRICRENIKRHNAECKAKKLDRVYYWPMIQTVPPIMVEDVDKVFHPERYITDEMKWELYLRNADDSPDKNTPKHKKKK